MRFSSPLRQLPSVGKFGRYHPIPSSSSRPTASYFPPLIVSSHILRPSYVPVNFFSRRDATETLKVEDEEENEQEGYHGEPGVGDLARGKIRLGGDEERGVRHSAQLAAKVLREVSSMVQPGVTPGQIDMAVHQLIVDEYDAYPSPLGYMGFPKSLTTSVNNVVCHGIPDERPLEPTDLINLDITVYALHPLAPASPRHAYHGDNSQTICLPDVDAAGRELVEVTKEALEIGTKVCGPDVPFREIGRAIDSFVRKHGMSVNPQMTGHGIGRLFHTAPWILHHKNDEPGTMSPGHCFTIEPCIVQGDDARGVLWDDGWTMVTRSGARSAQFEHQILITDDGFDVLTRLD